MALNSVKKLNVVDIFSGCGGLSLGFDLYKGSLRFHTVMALDNWSSAIKCLNDNLPKNNNATFEIGRVCDLTWFEHESEVLLYYLTHYAYSQPNKNLSDALVNDIDLPLFLGSLKTCDSEFEGKFQKLISTDEYQSDIKNIDKKLNSLALFKSFLNKLGISSFSKHHLDLSSIPWTKEYTHLPSTSEKSGSRLLDPKILAEMNRDSKSFLQDQVSKIFESSEKKGHGQHSENSRKLETFKAFFSSNSGIKFSKIWTEWHSKRTTIRAAYCLQSFDKLKSLYRDDTRVDVVLGGPPCKGFSRIGRAVLDSLRSQGASAWTHHEFGDERNALMYKYVLFLKALKPKLFLFENVSNFQSELKTPNGVLKADDLLKSIIDDCSAGDVSYKIHSSLFNSRNYGVPQDRIRYIMVGIEETALDEEFDWNQIYPSKLKADVELKYALQGLGEPGQFSLGDSTNCGIDYETSAFLSVDINAPSHIREYVNWIRQKDPLNFRRNDKVDGHIFRKGRSDDMEFLKAVSPGTRWMDLKIRSSKTLDLLKKFISDNSKAKNSKELSGLVNDSLLLRLLIENADSKITGEPSHLLSDSYLKKGSGDHGDWFERLSANKPCKTIVAHIGKDTYGYFHPYEQRAITIREAARVQSFPDFFKFSAIGVVDAYTVIGNAVAPMLANYIASRIAHLDSLWDIFSYKKIRSLPSKKAPRSQEDRQLEMEV